MGIGGSKVVPDSVSLTGKVAIITGANTGIGYITAKDFTKRKAHVILACRSEEKGKAAVENIKKELSLPEATIEFMSLDLGSLASIRRFASDFKSKGLPLHILVNNAGIMNTPFEKTVDGFESQFGVNHLGHFLLTNLLLDLIKKSTPSRIVVLSSAAHQMGHMDFDDLMFERKTYRGWPAYGNSKLANILFAYELSRRLEGTGVSVYAVHPGFVATELTRHTWGGKFFANLVAKSPEDGALTSIYTAISPDVEGQTGKYWVNCNPATTITESYNKEVAKKLWDVSEKLVQLDSDKSEVQQTNS